MGSRGEKESRVDGYTDEKRKVVPLRLGGTEAGESDRVVCSSLPIFG